MFESNLTEDEIWKIAEQTLNSRTIKASSGYDIHFFARAIARHLSSKQADHSERDLKMVKADAVKMPEPVLLAKGARFDTYGYTEEQMLELKAERDRWYGAAQERQIEINRLQSICQQSNGTKELTDELRRQFLTYSLEEGIPQYAANMAWGWICRALNQRLAVKDDQQAKDAARYRFLRAQEGHCNGCFAVSMNIGHDWITVYGDELDGAIDGAAKEYIDAALSTTKQEDV